MAIAPQVNPAQSQLTHKTYRSIGSLWSQVRPVRRPARLSLVFLKQLWWHTKGYGTVLGVMLLVVGSLIFLNLHWLSRQLLPASTPKNSTKDASWTP